MGHELQMEALFSMQLPRNRLLALFMDLGPMQGPFNRHAPDLTMNPFTAVTNPTLQLLPGPGRSLSRCSRAVATVHCAR